MGRMDDSIGDYVVPVDNFGSCRSAHLTFARHTGRPFVEVSKKQFFAAIGARDIVTSVMGNFATGYSRFATRWGDKEVGRLYSGRGSEASNYVLTAAFAQQCHDVLETIGAEDESVYRSRVNAEEHQARERERPR